MKKVAIANWNKLQDRTPTHALLADVDLVIVRYDGAVSVLYGRCAHRGALMADGHVDGDNLICGVHGWDYRVDTGISEYNHSETLPKFGAWIEDGQVIVDEDEIASWAQAHPQPYKRDAYQGAYQDHSHGQVLALDHAGGDMALIRLADDDSLYLLRNPMRPAASAR